jgi:uncharacterized protein (TIGR02246 family)
MLRMIGMALCVALLAFTVSCSGGGSSTGLGSAAGGVAGPDTREADIRAVRDLEATWVKDAATRDPGRFASYYAEDASVLLPGMPVINGKAAILAVLKPMLADPNFAVTFLANRVEASKGGDFVYSQGPYQMTMSDPKTKAPVTEKGKYLTIYKKQTDGSWKAVADMLNSDSADH